MRDLLHLSPSHLDYLNNSPHHTDNSITFGFEWTRGQSVLLISNLQLKERIRDLEEKVRQLEQQNPGLAAALAKAQQQSHSGGARSGTPPSTASSSAAASRGGGYQAFDPAAQQQGWNNPYLGSAEQQRLPHSDIRSTAQLDPYGAGFSSGGGGGGGSGQVIPGMNQFMLSAAQQHAQNLRAMDPSMFAVAPDTSNDPLPSELDPNELCVSPSPKSNTHSHLGLFALDHYQLTRRISIFALVE